MYDSAKKVISALSAPVSCTSHMKITRGWTRLNSIKKNFTTPVGFAPSPANPRDAFVERKSVSISRDYQRVRDTRNTVPGISVFKTMERASFVLKFKPGRLETVKGAIEILRGSQDWLLAVTINVRNGQLCAKTVLINFITTDSTVAAR